MLEEVKTILINQKEKELNQIEVINKQIADLNQKEKQNNFTAIDKHIIELENEIARINQSLITKLSTSKKLKKLYDEYYQLSANKIKVLEEFNNEREKLIIELSKLISNAGLIEQEIINIKKANTLQELGLNEETAKSLLRKNHNHYEDSAIQKVFSKVVLRKPSTREEIFRIMQELYQTNSSVFVLEMQKISPTDLANQLIEIGIVIDKDKLNLMNKVYYYLKQTNKILPTMQDIEITDRLDHYYCNEIEKVLANIENYPNINSTALSQMLSLTAIVSIAKENKKTQRINK
ncbi:MAG: hypothetical protein MRZ42_03695 [Tenericutes bacterium]|nr:hypothetical protein [Mycoplasmatota bacterium]